MEIDLNWSSFEQLSKIVQKFNLCTLKLSYDVFLNPVSIWRFNVYDLKFERYCSKFKTLQNL